MHTCNGEICSVEKEIFVPEQEWFPKGQEFFPQMKEIYKNDFLTNARVLSSLKLLAYYFGVTAMLVVFANGNLVFEKTHFPVAGGEIIIPTIEYTQNYNSNEFIDLMNYYIEWRSYVVQDGDTLWDIADTFTGNGLAYHAIAERNQIGNPHLIFPGQRITIPVLHPINET